MAIDWRKATLVGGALMAGVAAGAIGMMSLRGGDGPYAGSPAPATRTLGAAPASTAFLAAVAGNCEIAPMLATAVEGDGQEVLQAKATAASVDAVGALILSGKEAAAAGRQRDAEVAFLNACRNAAVLKEGDGALLADAMYQLGRHYANAAAFGAPGSADLFQRAERLYSASLEAYRARYGEEHEKTRFAREGLITVQQATGGKAPTAIAKAPDAPVIAAAPAPVPATGATEPVAPAPLTPAVTAAAPAAAPVVAPPAPAPRVAKAPATPKPDAATPAREPVAADEKPAQPRRSAAAVAAEAKAPVAEDPDPPLQQRRAPARSATAQAEPEPEAPAPVVRPRPLRVEPPRPEIEPPAFEPPPPPTNALGAGADTPTAEGSAGTP
jgi:hypothetical protein